MILFGESGWLSVRGSGAAALFLIHSLILFLPSFILDLFSYFTSFYVGTTNRLVYIMLARLRCRLGLCFLEGRHASKHALMCKTGICIEKLCRRSYSCGLMLSPLLCAWRIAMVTGDGISIYWDIFIIRARLFLGFR